MKPSLIFIDLIKNMHETNYLQTGIKINYKTSLIYLCIGL